MLDAGSNEAAQLTTKAGQRENISTTNMDKQKLKSVVKPHSAQRSLSPAAGSTSGVRFPSQSRQPETNIFQHLAVFFACGAPAAGLAGTGSHVMGNADDTVLLPILLRDIAKRKCSFEKLIRDLTAYCKGKDRYDLKGQIFLGAVVKVLNSLEVDKMKDGHNCLTILARLVYHFNGALEDLLSEICNEPEQSSEDNSENVLLCLLEMSLIHAQLQEINVGSDQIRFVNRVFSFGETPIIFAARKRNYDVMKLLLRYGADVMTKWLNFSNTLEVLLFAPHMVFVSQEELLSTEKCICLVSAAFDDRAVLKGLVEKESNGYFPLCAHWRDILPRHISQAQGPSLKHLSRQVVRNELARTGSLPHGIRTLPLPTLLKEYVDYDQL